MARSKKSIKEFMRKMPGAISAYHFVWAWAGSKLHKNPSRELFVIGITGTKGKTTTLEVLNAILESAGKKTALLSSLRAKIDDESRKNTIGNSMPGRGYIQKFLRAARNAKCNYALIEVTSQGVVMHRHRFVHWNIGALTNLSPEHIEAHGSFENYRAAKLEFLEYVIHHGGKIFLNRDDKHFPFFLEELQEHEPVLFSREEESLREHVARLRTAQARREVGGQREDQGAEFLLSNFNQENIAAAIAIAKELGIADRAIDQGLLDFQGVPGRMEFVRRDQYTAIVDYAHTPDSLEAAYNAARPARTHHDFAPRLICVLGAAGGGRDKWKRSEMGAIAAQYCDEIILTDEDPYDESPEGIVEEVRQGIEHAPTDHAPNVQIIMDRKEAIRTAVSMMREGDVVIGTGKGSEDYIHLSDGRKVPWNERKTFEEALDEKVK